MVRAVVPLIGLSEICERISCADRISLDVAVGQSSAGASLQFWTIPSGRVVQELREAIPTRDATPQRTRNHGAGNNFANRSISWTDCRARTCFQVC